MQAQKQNYVSVTYEFQKGLVFKWNFRDLFQYTTYFHHIFVIRSHSPKQLTIFLNNYFKKMKSGDLFSAYYYNQQRGEIRRMKWIERTKISTFDFSAITKKISTEPLPNDIKQEMIHRVIEDTQSNTSHYVVNIMLQEMSEPQEELKQMVEEGRKMGGLTHICTFFGSFKLNSISFTSGINFIRIQNEDLQTLLQFYSVHLNSAAIKKAKVTLQSSNAQILAFHDAIWKNVGFNKVQKMFFGPSVSYTHDQLHFFMSETAIGQQFQLVISLQIHLFSGQVLKDIKRTRLCVPNQKHLDKSINMYYYQSQANIQDLWICNTLYSTFAVAKLIKNTIQ